MDCINNIRSVDTSECIKPCSGLIVTSFIKTQEDRKIDNWLTVLEDYKAYKKITPFPIDEQGKTSLRLAAPSIIFASIDYEWKNKLRFVRIYFDTPTFDRIRVDKAAKFVDMLSAIGGTMGLLTGFSIISGVEILYFAFRIIVEMFKKRKSVEE